MSDEGEGRPDRGIVMRSLRPGFAGLAAVLLVAAVALQYFAVQVSAGDSGGGLNGGLPNSYVLLTIMSTLSGFCIAVAIALVVGIIASLVIEEAMLRLGRRGESADSDESEALSAYGSDPELL